MAKPTKSGKSIVGTWIERAEGWVRASEAAMRVDLLNVQHSRRVIQAEQECIRASSSLARLTQRAVRQVRAEIARQRRAL